MTVAGLGSEVNDFDCVVLRWTEVSELGSSSCADSLTEMVLIMAGWGELGSEVAGHTRGIKLYVIAG